MFKRVGESIGKTSYVLGSAAVGCILCIIVLSVLMRYLFGRPTGWGFAYSSFIVVACYYMALAYTESRGGHIRMDIVITRLPPRVQGVLGRIDGILNFLYVGVLTFCSMYIVLESHAKGFSTCGVIEVPYWIPQIIPVIGGGLFLAGLMSTLLMRAAREVPGAVIGTGG